MTSEFSAMVSAYSGTKLKTRGRFYCLDNYRINLVAKRVKPSKTLEKTGNNQKQSQLGNTWENTPMKNPWKNPWKNPVDDYTALRYNRDIKRESAVNTLPCVSRNKSGRLALFV